MWQLGAVRYILTPAQIWWQIQSNPKVAATFEPIMGFNVHEVLEYAPSSYRLWLEITAWSICLVVIGWLVVSAQTKLKRKP